MKKKEVPLIKRRDPASFLKAMGAFRTKPCADKRRKIGRKSKHKKADE